MASEFLLHKIHKEMGVEQEPEESRHEKEQERDEGAVIQEQETPTKKAVRRRQRVILNGKASQWKEVTASIIQGSCLGPTLAKCFSNNSHEGRILLQADKPLI